MSEKINTYIKEKKPFFSVSQKANKNAVFQFMNWELQETNKYKFRSFSETDVAGLTAKLAASTFPR